MSKKRASNIKPATRATRSITRTNTAINEENTAMTAPKAKAAKRSRDIEECAADPHTPAPSAPKKPKVACEDPPLATTPPDKHRRSGRTTSAVHTHSREATAPKKKRRTKAEMAAARAAVEAAKQQHKDDTKKASDQLVQMNIDDRVDHKKLTTHMIRKLSDIPGHSNKASAEEEFVGFHEASESSTLELGDDSESESSSIVSASELEDVETVNLKDAYKALQREMKALREKLDSGKKQGDGGKKLTQTKASTFATGLLPDWKSHSERNGKASRSSKITVSEGGLNDDDASAQNPYSAAGDGKSRNRSRQNNLVAQIVELSDLEDDDTYSKPIIKPSRKPIKFSEPKAVKAVKPEPNDDNTSKPNNKTKLTRTTTEAVKENKKRRILNTNNIRVDDLPDFATEDNRWRKVFLPSLYDKFFASSDPFSKFLKGSETFISLLQKLVEVVYPDIEYTVSANDPIHAVAYNRINEKRSAIGNVALKVVKKHLNGLDDAKAQRDWLIWALRSDGPLFFKGPVDPSAPRDRSDPTYVNPSGRLLSNFIIDVFVAFIRLKTGSISRNHHPRGLVALIMAALERAVQSCRPGHKLEDFSNGLWGSKVIAYYRGIGDVDENRWEMLLKAADIDNNESKDESDEEYRANISFMDNNRAVLFNFASPVKNH